MYINHYKPFIIAGQERVGFTAVMTTPDSTLPGGASVIWESVISNVGGGYQPNSGEFICPQDGLYYFVVSVMTNFVDDR